MHGRNFGCLLTLSILMLASSSPAQTNSTPQNWRDVISHSEPRSGLLPEPIPQPVPVSPRVPILPPRGVGLREIIRAAGLIFSGKVMKIERRPANATQPLETVAITFHVENAIRGTNRNENLTILQWAGLWSSGQRYRVGERVMLFLYPASKLGLSSCVGGPMGRFEMDAWGRVLISAHHLFAFRTDPVLGGKSHVPFSDFALAVRQASEEE